MEYHVPIRWVPRDRPLEPVAVAAVGSAGRALALRMLESSDDELAGLSGVASEDTIVLLGPADRLPWVDGVQYFGKDPAAPALLFPTTHTSEVPISLLERTLRRRFASLSSPILVMPAGLRVVPVSRAMPVTRAALSAWLEEQAR